MKKWASMRLRVERALGVVSLGLAVLFVLMLQQWQLTEAGVWRSILDEHLTTFVLFLMSLGLGAVLVSLEEESSLEVTEESRQKNSSSDNVTH